MSILTLTKRIPDNRLKQYTSIGWEEISSFPGKTEGRTTIRKEVETKTGHDDRTDCNLNQPYLIQRAKINRPLGQYDKATLTNAVNLDYMDAAEFEFGALPRSLRRVQAQFPLYEKYKVPHITSTRDGKKFVLRMFANFDRAEDYDQYVKWLIKIRNGDTLNLKESTNFDIQSCQDVLSRTGEERLEDDTLPSRNDFWWDIENDVFWTFDKNFMNNLEGHLKSSFAAMG